MHKKWAELIPYYVAGTLSPRQAVELERHLAECEHCRHHVHEWQGVAALVRSDAQRWAMQTPQMPSPGVLSHVFSSNGPKGSSTQIQRLSPGPSRPASIMTMAAAIAVLLLVGALLIVLVPHHDSSSRGALPEHTGTPTEPIYQAATSAANLVPPPTFTPFSGRYSTPTPSLLQTSLESQPNSGSTFQGPTPTVRFGDKIGSATASLITLEPIDQIPPNTLVRIDYAWYDGSNWIYAIVTTDGRETGYARDWQLSIFSGNVPPVVTPTARYQDSIGLGGYSMITLEKVGPIPAGARVRISHAWHDGTTWMYAIYTQNDAANAEAREDQIAYAPGVTPGPTPTSPYDSSYGYAMITLEQVGDIPANTRIAIGSSWYDRIDGWTYQIVTQKGITANARQSQIAYSPLLTPGPIPTSQFNNFPGGYALITLEQIGQIPANTRVRLSHSWYDGIDGWTIVIVAQDERTTAEARENQIAYAPGVTPGPTPTSRFLEQSSSGYPLKLLKDVGSIRAGEPVRIGGAHFMAIDGWVYTVVAQDEVRAAEVSEDLIAPIAASSPTPTPASCPFARPLTRDCPQTQFQIVAAYMPFEKGFMLWRGDTRQIYALYADNNTYDTFADTWREGETIPDDGQQPPAGTSRPQRGFGKVWATQPNVRTRLGWATGAESGYSATVEMFNFNIVLTMPDGQVLLLEELPPIWVLVP